MTGEPLGGVDRKDSGGRRSSRPSDEGSQDARRPDEVPAGQTIRNAAGKQVIIGARRFGLDGVDIGAIAGALGAGGLESGGRGDGGWTIRSHVIMTKTGSFLLRNVDMEFVEAMGSEGIWKSPWGW